MLIKIGDRYINMSNVTSISPVSEQFLGRAGTLEIEFVGRSNEDWGSTWIEGDDARALLAWLDQNSQDVRDQAPPPLSERIDRAVQESSGPVVADIPF